MMPMMSIMIEKPQHQASHTQHFHKTHGASKSYATLTTRHSARPQQRRVFLLANGFEFACVMREHTTRN